VKNEKRCTNRKNKVKNDASIGPRASMFRPAIRILVLQLTNHVLQLSNQVKNEE
jgi:hypothetical protein